MIVSALRGFGRNGFAQGTWQSVWQQSSAAREDQPCKLLCTKRQADSPIGLTGKRPGVVCYQARARWWMINVLLWFAEFQCAAYTVCRYPSYRCAVLCRSPLERIEVVLEMRLFGVLMG
jgi:hypothetical protein